MTNHSELHGKAIRTYKGNLLCCIEVKGHSLFFAMDKNGLRFLFVHEIKRGKYLTIKEWNHALETWDNAKVETLAGRELSNAIMLAPFIADNFKFGMSSSQEAALPLDHMVSFN